MPAGCSPPRILSGTDRLRSQPSAGRLWSYLSQTQFVGELHEELSNSPEFLLLAETFCKTQRSHGPREKSKFSAWLLRSTVRREIQFGPVLHRIFRKTRSQTDRNSRQSEETPMEPTAACSERTPAGRTAQPASPPAPRTPARPAAAPAPRRFLGTRHDFGVKLPLEISHLPETSPGPPEGVGRGQGRAGLPHRGTGTLRPRRRSAVPQGTYRPGGGCAFRSRSQCHARPRRVAPAASGVTARPGAPLPAGRTAWGGRGAAGRGAVRAAGALRRDSGERPVAAAGCVTRRAEPGLPALHRRAPPPAPLPPAAARTATRGARLRPALTGRDGTGQRTGGARPAWGRQKVGRCRPVGLRYGVAAARHAPPSGPTGTHRSAPAAEPRRAPQRSAFSSRLSAPSPCPKQAAL